MHAQATQLPEVLLLTPRVFEDERGCFMETWQRRTFAGLGIDYDFVQDNCSHSQPGTLRGLHYQIIQPQGKLVRVSAGEIFDVAVDLRQGSPTYGRWAAARLSARNRQQLWVPPGFAHGFLALTQAEVHYKCTDYYAPEHERTLLWNDPQINVSWPLSDGGQPRLSPKAAAGTPFAEVECYV